MNVRSFEPQSLPDDTEPALERQIELHAAYERSLNPNSSFPYENVSIRTRGELLWIMRRYEWSGEIDRSGKARANFRGASFSGANLSGVPLYMADLTDAIFVQANLSEAILIGVSLQDASLVKAILRESHVVGAVLDHANLREADLSHANLQRAVLQAANLSRANLTEACLFGADLREAKLIGVNLCGADLGAATIDETTNLEGIILDAATRLPKSLRKLQKLSGAE